MSERGREEKAQGAQGQSAGGRVQQRVPSQLLPAAVKACLQYF